MNQPSGLSALDELRRQLGDKSRQLSELDLMLADYHSERARLIRDLRRLKARLHNAEEQLQPGPIHLPDR
jgi:uncharacterized coiled-coil protein SlyX